jgi:hypothetical protein
MMVLRFHPNPRCVSGFGGRGAAKFGIRSGRRLGAAVRRRFRQFSGNSPAESHHMAAPRSQLLTELTAPPAVVGDAGS